MAAPAWLAALEPLAPEWSRPGMDRRRDRHPARLRRELRRRAGPGTAAGILAQQEAIADALAGALAATARSCYALRAARGTGTWRRRSRTPPALAGSSPLAAAMSAAGEWPADDPPRVRPAIPGRADATREELLVLLDKSRRSLAESAEEIAGHETERCPLDHPLVGHLRCGEWLLFAGVHDLMHLEQLHRLLGDD